MPLKPHRNARGHQRWKRHCGAWGPAGAKPCCSAWDEGPDTLIPSGLKCKEKEQSPSREAPESLGGAGSVPLLGSAPGTRSSRLGSAFPASSARARGIKHLDLDTVEMQLLLHASRWKRCICREMKPREQYTELCFNTPEIARTILL